MLGREAAVVGREAADQATKSREVEDEGLFWRTFLKVYLRAGSTLHWVTRAGAGGEEGFREGTDPEIERNPW